MPQGLVGRVSEFVRGRRLGIDVVRGGPCTVSVVETKGRRACTPRKLHVGGWIACPAARQVAARLRIPARQAGALLDLLDIKIRKCELGCF